MPNATMATAPTQLTLAAATAAELMSTNPVSIPADALVAEAMAVLTERGFSAAPVIDEAGRPLGVISRTDLLIHERARLLLPPGPATQPAADTTRVADLMTPAVFSVTPTAPVRSVVQQMLGLKVRHLFVVDDTGVLIGVISPLDVLRRLV